jgi:hypothetical protein
MVTFKNLSNISLAELAVADHAARCESRLIHYRGLLSKLREIRAPQHVIEGCERTVVRWKRELKSATQLAKKIPIWNQLDSILQDDTETNSGQS